MSESQAILHAESLETVLDGIEQIGWKAMEHCRGSAENVPGLLRRFLGSPGAVSEQAESQLWDALCSSIPRPR